MNRIDVEEIQSTRTEKLLAVVMAAFLLLGAIWTYQKLDDVIRHAEPLPAASVTESPAVARLNQAENRQGQAVDRERSALRVLVLRREAYRTALEAHRPAKTLASQYDQAQRAYAVAQQQVAVAVRAVRAAQPAAVAAERSAQSQFDAVRHRQDRDTFLARLGMVAFAIVLAYVLLATMRRRGTRWFPLAGSVVAAATILTFVLASDYLTDYFNPFDWGIAFIAALGVVATLLAYWTLERYIVRRLPQRRVRKGQCPFCGYPAGAGAHCEGCGREIVAPCTACESPRRVGTIHCAICGATSSRITPPVAA